MSAFNRCSDRELRDIGLCRGDIAYGVGLPEGKYGANGTASKLYSAGWRP